MTAPALGSGWRRRLLLLMSVALAWVHSPAGGLESGAASARSLALGGAVAASWNDITALHANPALLSFLKGTALSIGATVLVPDVRFTGPMPDGTTTRMENQVLFPPNAFLSHTFSSGVGIGVSATLPVFLRNEWPTDWAGGRLATRTEFRTVLVSPTVSIPVTSRLSVGVALLTMFSRMQLNRRVGVENGAVTPPGTASPDIREELSGSSRTACGAQAGVLYRAGGGFSLGASYRSRIRLTVADGLAHYEGVPANLMPSFPEGKVTTVLVLPHSVRLGLLWQPFESFLVAGDLEYAAWNDFREISVGYTTEALAANAALRRKIGGGWHSTTAASCGAEIELLGVQLRAGYAYDPTPVPDRLVTPLAPDADRKVFSGGLGYTVSEGLRLDFAYSVQMYVARKITDSALEYAPNRFFNGEYSGKISVFAMNVSYHWD